MGFTRDELLGYRDRTVADLVGDDCRLLFVGINPGLWTAATGAHFARPGNRFYPALARAGIVDHVIDASTGMSDADRKALLERGVGITNVVARATATAAELTAQELRDGGVRLRERVRAIGPRVVAVAGITAYRSAFGRRDAVTGRQDETWDGAQLWVVPNPSGLNAHETVDSLATAYREAAVAAGVV
ncbi:mismatch-specific DNA-glycosylase [Gordonia jinghuaiqii]|uniref:Mismatch-specific DNA-glycosylase n=1 Tax=Gordonia jinghuaiqii TaxID=2758710 RepID=A0A7D7LRW2_9ACTN|nr:mismatch-specific DNA-glycosylase [Gordonia jinghuaiqii]MCR5976789.1 mismatch-specific DNA-glycosylase [Gordonia jinghuaiqii]QMS99960.1 mismatch-specific DNA-glycosylase [Gordonia jinghuaiqii]